MKTYITHATADVPDTRDLIYQPSLKQLSGEITTPENLHIRNQGKEGACTGFALTAVIDFLNQKRKSDLRVSARMVYEMAKKNDEWPGEDYDGSSLRGAIKGWKNMGVCSEDHWPYLVNGGIDYLSIDAAKNARHNTIGAYYRLKPDIAHFHSAINESGIIAVSARVHRGWQSPKNGVIERNPIISGGHAFAIVGYNDRGFIIQNSWGKQWGDQGTALWLYEDWIDTLMDAWVVSLALPTPQIFGLEAHAYKGYQETNAPASTLTKTVNRAEIAGHFVHIDDGQYHDKGRYWSNAADVEQTAQHVANSSDYDHVLFYFHGGLNSPKASARRIRAMKDGFKRNRVYPFHIMYDTGLMEEIKDLILRKGKTSTERVGGFSDWTDRFLEGLLRRPGTMVWDEMKQGAQSAFTSKGDGLDSLNRFIKHLGKASPGKKKKIHLCGHSTGAIVIAHLLRALQNKNIEIATCSLLAPAASLKLFHSHYLPIYQKKRKLKLNSLELYLLRNHLEEDDHVAGIYRKSLLYLVSNSFEHDGRETPIVGMENFVKEIKSSGGLPKIHYSNGNSGSTTRSRSHGGFDNDTRTMNHVLKSILGHSVKLPFKTDDLDF
ncbi:C1 family peptidase [Verrucomicrobiaceae bacterium N1E253]|uniref:C1 family peptidase n=1 Tax=Oceaniferula marina TaxID=2748318 RepID=A0A851GDN1_9BACT|nr:C1 family peptidase [Oceaniferula marina]NWK55526.1 C1 family peptidase [Oceaniferula marina]